MSPLPASKTALPPTRPALADAVERLAASVVGVVRHRGAAAGLIWQPGVVLTSASVVWRASTLQLVLPGGEPVEGRLLGADAATDIAAIAFDAGAAEAQVVAEDEAPAPRAGDFVFAVGREPSGLVQASFGHVGAAGGAWRTWRGGRIDRLVRLDGGLYPGLAGAAIGDEQGRCLGLASPAFSRLHGMVLPRDTLQRVAAALLADGRVRQGWLGIAAQPVRAQADGRAVEGLLVSSVDEDGPAARAGVLVGDVLVSIDGQPLPRIEALRERLAGLAIDSVLAVQIARGGRTVELNVQVAERPRGGC